MKKYIYLIAMLTFNAVWLTSCSEEKESIQTNDKSISLTSERLKDGSIPQYKLIYAVLAEKSKYSLNEIDTMYREDIITTEPDYDANLKNTWLIIINERLISEGNDDLKRYYLKEQIDLKQSLANIKGFYNLLLSSRSFLDTKEMREVSVAFQQKNQNYIKNVIQWKDEEAMKAKLQELTYEAALFQRLLSTT
ncbi:hypothetical protein [Flavobacterium litorale]|uniref:DUF4296 domain-containing protein n=1 Tax=Flavobacterium litorale TaxID=2856519 RepID=A0ABX8V5E0_9FLAO|nr:hypothetical protein [Flavobacterium litorale]QYJ67977.1 hypothetical protein K1I41_10620 [Flavobacterium litorale]